MTEIDHPPEYDEYERMFAEMASTPPPAQYWDDCPPEQAPDPTAADPVSLLIGELLGTDDLDNIPNLQPLIAEVLFLDSLARINGPSGHGKSFVSLDMAGSVGTGTPWHGRTVRQGTVVYLVAEGAKGIRKRVRAWEQTHGRKMTGVWFLPRPVQAADHEWYVLVEACRRIRPVLVIVDTQARVTVGVEENSATEMGRIIHRMEELRAASEACVLLIHHKGLNGDHGRGSTAVKGAMQTELTVTKDGKGTDTRVTVATDKQKDSEEIGKLTFHLRQLKIDGEAEEDGSPVTSAVLILDSSATDEEPAQKLSPAARKLLDALEALTTPATNSEVVDQVKHMHNHGLSRETASKELNELHRRNLAMRIPANGGVLWQAARASP